MAGKYDGKLHLNGKIDDEERALLRAYWENERRIRERAQQHYQNLRAEQREKQLSESKNRMRLSPQ